jgi:polyisoprenoid-binding protein YceI
LFPRRFALRVCPLREIMKTLLKSALAAVILSVPSLALASTWEIDSAHTNAQFSVKYMMMTDVKGEFANITGTVNLDEKDITKSTVKATFDAATLDTRHADRDTFLKGKEFFEVEKYKTITFESKKVEKAGEGKLKVTGDLTMHGVTRQVTLDVAGPSVELKDPHGKVRRGLAATTKLSRKDFGLGWNVPLESGGVLLSDEVLVSIDLALIRKDAAPATAKGAP